MKRLKLRIPGPAGMIETVVDDPEGERAGLILIAHPHPLHGGSLDNKVVVTLARAATEHGRVAVRANFRGVGSSEGEHDGGRGETDDLKAVIGFIAPHYPGLTWVLAGFSFGAYVQHRVASNTPHARLILVAPAVDMYDFDPLPRATVIIHGGGDELFPVARVTSWAETQGARLSVIEGAGHFFHGKLAELAKAFVASCDCDT